MQLDAHQVALIDLAGIALNAFGTLYLAYDLLGGEAGPLRIVTRALTYGLLFALSYGIFLGARFGLVAALGLGGALAVELPSALGKKELSKTRHVVLAAVRGLSLGLGVALTFDWKMGLVIAVVATIALAISYFAGFAPSHSARSLDRLPKHFHRTQLLASLVRGLIYLLAGFCGGLLFGDLRRGVRIGGLLALVVAITSAATSVMSPYVEVWATELPPKRMGFYGILMMIAGSLVQTIQYWPSVF
jgi:hypothetical protein